MAGIGSCSANAIYRPERSFWRVYTHRWLFRAWAAFCGATSCAALAVAPRVSSRLLSVLAAGCFSGDSRLLRVRAFWGAHARNGPEAATDLPVRLEDGASRPKDRSIEGTRRSELSRVARRMASSVRTKTGNGRSVGTSSIRVRWPISARTASPWERASRPA
jgi:hypothetical protein